MPLVSSLDQALGDLLEKARQGDRLTPDEGVALFEVDLFELGQAADGRRRRLHPENLVTFIIDRYINYTNVCITDCGFCAFYRRPGHEEGYVRSKDEILKKVEALVALGGTTVLLQGGHHPRLPLDYYTDLFRSIKARFPIHLHCLTASEIDHLAKLSKRSIEETLTVLHEAGLDSLPGGGAEILVDRVRQEISPKKISADRWLEIHETTHRLGMHSTATMMMGSVETLAERIEHLTKVRALQDRTGGFKAFIHWSFTPGHPPLAPLPMPTAEDYLRTLAVARLFLDNIPHIHTGWVTEGPKIAQLGLAFGADDLGGILMEEEVISATGLRYEADVSQMVAMIRRAGRVPAQRNSRYEIVKVWGDSALSGVERAERVL